MFIFADLHLHSKYSRATSPDMNPETIFHWGKKKGLNLLGTGDFTHPLYFSILKKNLESNGKGLYFLKTRSPDIHFMLTAEVSNIFQQNRKTRRIHSLIFAPDIDIAAEINKVLGTKGNLQSDGRPIFGFSAKELVKIINKISRDCMVIPAHAWTPWFSVFGSKSGFESLEECYEEETPSIFALETGLSSDQAMNWRVSALDHITLISNSDAHSPGKIGREANVFESDLDYFQIMNILKTKDRKRFLFTVEYFPEEGKYHYDGHRACGHACSPGESKKNNNLCPVCLKPLTLGVLHRIDCLADRAEGFIKEDGIPQRQMLPLMEIIADVFKVGVNSQRVKKEYEKMILKGRDEFNILLNSSSEELRNFYLPEIAEGIIKVRKGKVKILPGYDGIYGEVKII